MDSTAKCDWIEVKKETWYTTCKHEYQLLPHDRQYKLILCPYCGNSISPKINLEEKSDVS